MTSGASFVNRPPEDYADFMTQLRRRTENQREYSNALIKLSAPVALSSPKTYALLLTSCYYVFQAMEHQLQTRRLQYPKISPIYFRELLRTPMFERDLQFYFPSGQIPPPSKATSDYVAHLKSSVEHDPVVLIAYMHALYMDLLSNGTLLRRSVVNAFALTPPSGCAVFDFSDTISDISTFRRRFSDAINSISLADAQKELIIRQKRHVYEQNNSIVREICSPLLFQRRLRSILLRVSVIATFLALLLYLMLHMPSIT